MNTPQKQLDADTFRLEQAHLSATHATLRGMEKSLENTLARIADQAAAEKLDIRENLALNFDGDSESMETFIEFEVMNHAIDHYNIEHDSATEKLGRVKRLLHKPYFAKVRLRYEPDEEPEEYYIGSAGISENALAPLVVDWRSPIAETYYNQDNGRTFYTVEGRKIEVELLLRRQFELEEDRLQAFFDTRIALADPLLIRSLTRQRTDKMQAITATIQKEQNAVVRHANVPVLLVNGIAGSGKTSVLLQRIAWLFYRQRDTLRPDEVVLLTLNPIFRRYIDQVLPDMGEMNPVSLTWNDFLSLAGVSKKTMARLRGEDGPTGAAEPGKSPQAPGLAPVGQGQAGASQPDKSPQLPNACGDGSSADCPADSLRLIEEGLPSLALEPEDLRPIRQKNLEILSPRQIAAVLAQYPHIPTGERLVQIAIDDLREIARREIQKKERRDREDDSAEENLPQEISAAEDNRIQSQYGGAFHAIGSGQWLDIARIGRRLLGKKRLTEIEWLYLKLLLTGDKDLRAKYVMVDEVQDYTPAQLMLLRKYFPRARFMLLGDEFQAIRDKTASFAQIHELFSQAGRDSSPAQKPLHGAVAAGNGARKTHTTGSAVTELALTTSYRSSPEITALFAALLPPEKQILVSSVQPSGRAPAFFTCPTREDYLRALAQAIREAAGEEGLTAVLCAGSRRLEKTASLLAAHMGDAALSFPVVRSGDALPARGVFLITLAHAKGLEFDGVVLADADGDAYPDTPLGRHRLYTALSRATSRLTVVAQGQMTPLLAQP